jgi:methyl-accepting chemotaxis protein
MQTHQRTVKTKLMTGFCVLAAITVVVSGLSLKALGDSNERFAGYVTGINARAHVAEQIRAAVDRRAIAARNMALVTLPADFDNERAAEAQAQRDVTAHLSDLKSMVAAASDATDESRALVGEIDRVETSYAPVAADIVRLAVDQKRDDAVKEIDEKCRPLLAALIKATDDYVAYTQTRASQRVQEAQDHYTTQRAMLIAICLAALAAGLIAGSLITRGILRALGAEPAQLSAITHRVATGDLSAIGGAENAPEGSVLASMAEMQRSLVKLIGEVRAAADSIATGSSQIATGNLDLSSRTEEQSSSLQETAASMEQLTATVKQNAENAQQASSLSTNASDIAQKGSSVVGQVVTTMGEISDSSNKISDITGIIEGIAFQTNILALNAAVEAARAGEQGRGFAVVASEVRSLAQRSSSAAKEIKELINSSVKKIQDGSSLAVDAGKTMNEVTQAVSRFSDIMGEIAAASAEQSRGIEQVNLAISQMDDATTQNAALVEEASAASQSLERQGEQLTEAISTFRTERVAALG